MAPMTVPIREHCVTQSITYRRRDGLRWERPIDSPGAIDTGA